MEPEKWKNVITKSPFEATALADGEFWRTVKAEFLKGDAMPRISAHLSQRPLWEISPKIFAVAVGRVGEARGADGARAGQLHREAFAQLRQRLPDYGLFCYGTFADRVYFGLPQENWARASGKFAIYRLFAGIIEVSGGALAFQDFYISPWALPTDRPILAEASSSATSPDLGDALRRCLFLRAETYIAYAPTLGLLPFPHADVGSPEESAQLVSTVREEDVYRAVFAESYAYPNTKLDILAFPGLVAAWLKAHPEYPWSAYARVRNATAGQIEVLLTRFARGD